MVTPEEERSKRENPLWKIIVRIRREKCVYERKRKRKKDIKSSFFIFLRSIHSMNIRQVRVEEGSDRKKLLIIIK